MVAHTHTGPDDNEVGKLIWRTGLQARTSVLGGTSTNQQSDAPTRARRSLDSGQVIISSAYMLAGQVGQCYSWRRVRWSGRQINATTTAACAVVATNTKQEHIGCDRSSMSVVKNPGPLSSTYLLTGQLLLLDTRTDRWAINTFAVALTTNAQEFLVSYIYICIYKCVCFIYNTQIDTQE